jgi:uncharacterized protein (DUF488 family)
VATIYTIGHSTREWQDFVSILSKHQIARLVDIRAFPMSRRMPHFNRERMAEALATSGVEYRWMFSLGGRRGKQREHSPNIGLRNQAFRNYADYMLTEEFRQATEELVNLASENRTSIMCAEKVMFNCHRMLVSDYLALHGHDVMHIEDARPPRAHRPTPEAHMVKGRVIYSAGELFRDQTA